MKLYDCVFLSPHLDDAVLSCGGRIWHERRAGKRVLVLTVFAGAPPVGVDLSPFAEALHARWGRSVGAAVDSVALRRSEDRAALIRLGVDVAHWLYTDCIYRQDEDGRFLYDSEGSLWGAVHPSEQGLIAELRARVCAVPLAPAGQVYAPLGVGRHVDHQLVRRAAGQCDHLCVYYEDYPYVQDTQALRLALNGVIWSDELFELSEEAVAAKTTAIACYRSQLNTFWADEVEMALAVRAFAGQTGVGLFAERYWKPAEDD